MRSCGFLVALVLAAAAPRAARAAACACQAYGALPPNGATGVPTNARIFVPGGSGILADQVSLAPETDILHPVPVTVEPTGGTLQEAWLVPQAELAPSTRYLVQLPVPPSTLAFTTGAGPDTTAPSYAHITLAGGALAGDCADHIAAVATATGLADDVVPPAELLLRVVVGSGDADAGTETRTVWLQGTQGAFGAFADLAWQDCLHNFNGVSTARTLHASVAALDWSGNESAATETDFRFRDNSTGGGCGCAVPGAAPVSPLLALALVAGVVAAARRRHPSGSATKSAL